MLFLTKYERNLIVHLWQDKPLGGVKNIWGIMFTTILLHFHYFTSLGNVNASVVTCQYPQI